MKQQSPNTGIYNALIDQLDKVARHNRQGSFRTKERYYEAMKRFCRFLAEYFRIQKLSNINAKHLNAYIIKMQEDGKSSSTIKTDLAAIRFFHDKMSQTKYRLPSNDELSVQLERRRFTGIDRTWTQEEFHRMLTRALAEDRYDYILALYLARYAGLRIHECFRIDTAAAAQALKEMALTVKGKGGKIRTVPINDAIFLAMQKQLGRTSRGHKLLVPDDLPTDIAIHRLQSFIATHRATIQTKDVSHPLTFHGLRHTYAAETYQTLIDRGVPPLEASLQVSRLLGHERKDVTNIYLASVKEDKDD